jgi:hypothetical protein
VVVSNAVFLRHVSDDNEDVTKHVNILNVSDTGSVLCSGKTTATPTLYKVCNYIEIAELCSETLL